MKEFLIKFRDFFKRPTVRGYEVDSGPWPYYRQSVCALAVGAIVNVIYGPPNSIKEGLPEWYVYPFLTMVILGCLTILFAIQFMRPSLNSLAIERFGTYLVLGAMIIYLGNFFYTTGVPKTFQTWLIFPLIIYPIQRLFEIRKEKTATVSTLKGRGLHE